MEERSSPMDTRAPLARRATRSSYRRCCPLAVMRRAARIGSVRGVAGEKCFSKWWEQRRGGEEAKAHDNAQGGRKLKDQTRLGLVGDGLCLCTAAQTARLGRGVWTTAELIGSDGRLVRREAGDVGLPAVEGVVMQQVWRAAQFSTGAVCCPGAASSRRSRLPGIRMGRGPGVLGSFLRGSAARSGRHDPLPECALSPDTAVSEELKQTPSG